VIALLWIIFSIVILLIFFTNYYFNFYGTKEITTIALPLFLAILPFFRDWWKERQELNKKQIKVKQELNKIKQYLQPFFNFDLVIPKIDKFEEVEDIYSQFIRENFDNIKPIVLNSILLSFYCKEWKEQQSPKAYENIQKQAYSLGLSLAKIDEKTNTFLKIFNAFKSDSKFNNLDEVLQREVDPAEELQKFANTYLKDLSFFEIKKELSQSENLRVTLITLIKDGQLSNWNITKETLQKLEEDLKKEIDYSKTFLVVGNKISDEIKKFLNSKPRFVFGAIRTKGTPKEMIYSAYIVKPSGIFSSDHLLKKLISLNESNNESIIFVVPLNFLESKNYTFPSNQSFSSQNLKDCYETLNWFKTGYEYSDADVWNVIGKSTITPNELLTIVPFNIFCQGILPCEQTFFIRHYATVKNRCGVNSLIEWKDKDSNLIRDYLLECGKPTYNNAELKNVLKVTDDKKIDDVIKIRLGELTEQIVKNSEKLAQSLTIPKGG
jgi:hypothetical protein